MANDTPEFKRLRDQLVIGIRSENDWHVAAIDALIAAVRAEAHAQHAAELYRLMHPERS